jgi:hypothetical protein
MIVLWLAPQFGNYVRPTAVLVNALLVNPLNNLMMVAIWAVAGFVGGVIAGTKAGAFVVGFVTWLTCIVLLVFCVIQIVMGGIDLGTIPPIPQGESLTSILSIPLVQSAITQALSFISGSGGTPDITALLLPFIIYILVPVVIVIITGIIGAIVRPKR